MKKTLFSLIAAMALLIAWAGSGLTYEAHIGPTELIYHDAAKADPGYTVFAPLSGALNENGDPLATVIDMDGQVVHQVAATGDISTIFFIYMLGDGTFLMNGGEPNATDKIYGLGRLGGGSAPHILRMDWNGNTLWDFDGFKAGATKESPSWWGHHHDIRRIWNKQLGEYTYIGLMWEGMSPSDAVNLGANPDGAYGNEGELEHHPSFAQKGYDNSNNGWSPDAVYEFRENGDIIWRWSFADHIVQNYAPAKTQPFNYEYMSTQPQFEGLQNPGAT